MMGVLSAANAAAGRASASDYTSEKSLEASNLHARSQPYQPCDAL
jgi:hypothetical protein